MESIKVNVSGSHTHYAPAERCVVSIRVSKEGESQASVIEAVTGLSNYLSELFKSLCPKDPISGKVAIENVHDPSVTVTHWSMSSLSTSSRIPYVPANRDGTEVRPAPRLYKATTSFSIKFKDFKKMGHVCLDIAKNDDISISNLDWRLTTITQEKLKLNVRQGAVRDAVDKALGYCSAFSPTPGTSWHCVAKEISDVGEQGHAGYGNVAPRAVMYATRSFGGGGEEGETLNFEPEDVSLSASVQCKFECSQEHEDEDSEVGLD